jgi:Tfp pilus assembly protein PilX
MNRLPKAVSSRERAAALIIVLAFVVLLTGLGVAYLSRATSDRQVAHNSFNQSNVDQLAQSAMDNIIGDLRQEILNGSGSPSPTASPVTLFVPTSNANMVQRRNNTASAIPNLIRRSIRSESSLWPDPVTGPALGSRASAVNSYADASSNARSISLARWNSHYLIPKSNTGDGGSNPITTGYSAPNYWAPDWVFVTSAGATPSPAPANVIGRYAYAIYDEGGLLDMNAAGYPSPTTILQYGRKGSLAFADLTGLGGFWFSATPLDNLIGWRNYASSQPSGTLSPPSSNLSFSANATNTYYNFILSDPSYIQLTNYFTGSPLIYFTNSFLRTSQASVLNNRTDQAMTARQELIKLRSAVVSGGISFSNALQYLGTFSREAAAGTPQWSPAAPDSINPNFQNLVVTNSFTRNDGTTANVGDYLVNKRFLLQRLNWLTYRGPSALRNIPTSAPAIGSADYDMWLLTRPDGIIFGLTRNFLLQGTAANIQKYFGLVWDATNERWNYVGTSGNPLPIASIATFGVGGTQAATREPDFFELLQAGIINGSLGDASSSDPALPLVHQQSKILHILTIGANLIAQSRADSYPVRIACSVGGTIMEAVGMPRLPCLSSLAACPVGVTQPSGGINWFLVPNLWNPFRDTWDLTEAHASNDNNPNHQDNIWLTPGYLRPPVRITVNGTASFGRATASQSGSVDPTSVAPFLGTSTGSMNASLTLATGDSTFGRDGLRESMRLGASDINGSVTSFTPTNSSSGWAWNDIVRPTNDPAYRTDHFVAFRISLPGSGIPAGTSQNPALILQPGFQVSLEYQSPNGQWYPYSFLQGNNATTKTGIGYLNPASPTNLDLATIYSQYGTNAGITTIFNSGTTTTTSWAVATLALAPMFAKADPRSIRYNSRIGVVNFANPPMSFTSAGIIASIWPSQYATPPPMTPSAFPIPTPTGSPNPATYSQVGDNGPAGSNPYNEFIPAGQTNSIGDTVRPIVMNRPFRSVGEMAYTFRDQPFRTLSFSSSNSPDAGLLDLFSTNDYSDSSGMRGGVVNLNSRQAPPLAAVLVNTIAREDTPRVKIPGPAQSPSPSPLGATAATNAATTLVSLTSSAPVKNKADLASLIANVNPVGFDATVPKTQRESMARALGEVNQTRTWNVLIDVIAQTGKYAPGEIDLKKFVVQGEQRYWVHVAIDRFTGQVIDKQIEVVNE